MCFRIRERLNSNIWNKDSKKIQNKGVGDDGKESQGEHIYRETNNIENWLKDEEH